MILRIGCSLLLPQNAQADLPSATPSLFLLPQEEKGQALAPPTTTPLALEGLEAIYLGSLLFQSHHHWTLWVNGRRITSDDDIHYKLPQGLKIEEVLESKVIFSVTLSKNRPPELVALHPNQTYLVAAQEIWEGDQRPAK